MKEISKISDKNKKNYEIVEYDFKTKKLKGITREFEKDMSLKEYEKIKRYTIKKARYNGWILEFEKVN